MNEDSLRIPVIVYLQSGENARGILVYRKEGPMIEIRDTGPITDTNGVQFQIVENETNLLPLKSNDRVNLKPVVMTKFEYSHSIYLYRTMGTSVAVTM